MKRILDTDPESGITTVFHSNEHDQTFTVETRQDVSQILKENAAQRNLTDKHTPYGDQIGRQTKVASIPMSIYADWMKKGYTKDQKKMKQLLNSPEYKYFRTREGKV